MAAEIKADVIIVGSGIAGSLVAYELARAGVRVAILEAGPRVDRQQAVRQFRNAVAKVPECAYPISRHAPHPTTDNPEGWYIQAGPDKFRSTYLRVVGGTTWHWLGTCLRFVPDDFRLQTKFGRGVDWPLTYDDLEPWYGAAEDALGVAGDASETLGSPRSKPYPMPAIPQTWLDRQFAQALAATRYDVRTTPQGRNSMDRDGRPACCGSASCIPICPIQAKYDATVHIAKAEASGAKLYDTTVAIFVEADGGRRVTAIRFKRPDGSGGRAVGKVYVLAAHAVETPRLLLASRGDSTPNGVANGSDQVGRNLMDHPTQLSWALSDAPVWPYRGPLSTSGIETLRTGPWRAERAAFRVEIGNDGWSWPTGAPVSTAQELAGQGVSGTALIAALKAQTSRQIRLASSIEQLPDPENRIVPDFSQRDPLGVPRPRLTYRLDEYVCTGLVDARRVHEEIFERLAASNVRHGTTAEGAGHIIGTTRMGSDPRQSVVDPDLRSHDLANLFIVGSGVFPTSATANPTLTIAALSLRAAPVIARSLAQ